MKTKHLGLKIFLIGAVCFAAVFNLETSPFRHIVPSAPFSECLDNHLAGDTYVYLYVGGLISKGLMPYRDFFDHKGPLLYLMMALGIWIGRVAGVWLVQSVFLFVSAYFAYKTARLLTSRAASAAASSLAVMWYSLGETGPDTLAVPFLLASLYSFVRFLLNGYTIGRLETLGVGACFGAVLLMKMNLVSLWIVFAASVVVSSIAGKRYVFLLERIALFLSGAALVALPILAWLWFKGAFDDFVRVYLEFNLTDYGDPPPLGNNLLFFIPMIFRRTLQAAVYWALYFCYNLPALLVYLFMVLHEKERSRKILFALLAAVLLLSIRLIGAKGFHFIYYCYPAARGGGGTWAAAGRPGAARAGQPAGGRLDGAPEDSRSRSRCRPVGVRPTRARFVALPARAYPPRRPNQRGGMFGLLVCRPRLCLSPPFRTGSETSGTRPAPPFAVPPLIVSSGTAIEQTDLL